MFRTRVHVGLDIGHHSVKAAVLGPNKKLVLRLLETELLPERAFLEDQWDERRAVETVRTTLAPILDPGAKLNPTLRVGFQSDAGVSRYLELPALKKDQVETALQSAASRLLTFPVQEAVLTSLPVPIPGRPGRSGGVFLLASPRKEAEARGAFLKKCGLQAERLEVSPLPLLRALTVNRGRFPGEPVALVRVGSRLTTVLVASEGNLYFARDFVLAGSHFTYALQMGAQSSWEEAEQAKRLCDATAREVALEPVLTRWLDQVRRNLEACARSLPELRPPVQRVFLSGGSAALKGLDARLEEALKTPVTREDWVDLVPPQAQPHAPMARFTTALGLALAD